MSKEFGYFGNGMQGYAHYMQAFQANSSAQAPCTGDGCGAGESNDCDAQGSLGASPFACESPFADNDGDAFAYNSPFADNDGDAFAHDDLTEE